MVRWMPRGWAWVDPAKEVQAYKEAVRCGFKTLGEVVSEQGGDLEELMAARAAELEMAEELELYFDTDPDQLDGNGGKQPEEVELEPVQPVADAEPISDNEAP